MFASQRPARVRCVEDFIRREILTGKLGDDGVADLLRHLATDDRADGAWKAVEAWGDSDCYLHAVAYALSALGCVEGAERHYDANACQIAQVREAVDLLNKRCAQYQARRDVLGWCAPVDLDNIRSALRSLAEIEEARFANAVSELAPLMHRSRKKRADFLVRVHFTRLLVRGLRARFGRPCFQVAADTTNSIFAYPGQELVSADSVRDAWRP